MSLRTTVFLWVLLLVAAALGTTMFAVQRVLEASARRQVADDVNRSVGVALALHAHRQSLYASNCRVTAEEPRLKAVVASEEVDRETVGDVALAVAQAAHTTMLLVTDKSGEVIADIADPNAKGSLADKPEIAAALGGADGQGIWIAGGVPHQVAACRLAFGAKLVGALVLGHALDDEMAATVEKQTGSSLVLALDGRPAAASSFGAQRPAAEELAAALKGIGDDLAEVTLPQGRYFARATTIPTYAGKRALRYVVFRSMEEALAPGRRLMNVLYAVMAIALLAVFGLALGLARRVARPIDALVQRTRLIGEGDFRSVSAEGPSEIRALATSMNDMAKEIDESRKRLADRERLQRELEIATRIQTSILPRGPIVKHLEVGMRMLPADEVGGDYYDVIPVEDGAWLAIGDVSGHGLTAGLIMMMAQTAVSAIVRKDPSCGPRDALSVLNRVIYENVRERLESDKHMTLSLVRYFDDGRLLAAGAHLDMIFWRAATRTCELVRTQGTWLSMIDDISDFTVEASQRLARGDLLVLYTDGIIEIQNGAREQFGMERLADEINRAADAPVQKIADVVLETARAWAKVQPDDMTVLVLRYTG